MSAYLPLLTLIWPGLLVAAWALVSVVFLRRKLVRLGQNRLELRLLLTAIGMTALASACFFYFHFYDQVVVDNSQTWASSEMLADGELRVIVEDERVIDIQWRELWTGLLVSGVPLVAVLLPLLFHGVSVRPVFEGLAVSMLGLYWPMGWGSGVIFLPGACLMLLAAIAALRRRAVD